MRERRESLGVCSEIAFNSCVRKRRFGLLNFAWPRYIAKRKTRSLLYPPIFSPNNKRNHKPPLEKDSTKTVVIVQLLVLLW